MGNTCKRCFGIRGDSRKFIRAKYTMTKDFSIEFENLVEEDVPEEIVRPITEHEKRLVKNGMLYQLVAQQAKEDEEIDEQLAAQEEALKIEEEAFYAERRAASASSRRVRLGARSQALAAVEDPRHTTADVARSDWSDVELDDDDFPVIGSSKVVPITCTPPTHSQRRPKSLKQEMEEEARRASTSAAPSQRHLQQHRLNQGFGDFHSVSSGREASIDLDWDHEPGMNPALAEGMERSATEEDLTRMVTSPRLGESPPEEDDHVTVPRLESPASLVWENDFTMDVSRRHLLAAEET